MTKTIGFLIFPDLQVLDCAGPLAAFEIAGRYQPGAYALKVMAVEPGMVSATCGLALAAGALQPPRTLDTLVVAGGEGTRPACEDPRTLDYVRQAAVHARRVASVCSGAYILAAAGLLDGRRATTHWNRSGDFARRFPAVRLEADRIFVKDGPVWTSAGITAGIDLALALIADDLGEEIARRTAQQLVVYHRRPGGQSQFSALLELERPESRFGPVLEWAREHLTHPLTVEQLADVAAMSARNFARAFAAETGVTPAKAVERLRLDAARARLDAGEAQVDQIARQVGFGDPDRMRRAFLRAFGQPPQAFRRASRRAA
ncbi:GlxA family transcriptional regulator [Caulobacter sp. KR2-114]|uniref:GlxA family transcriptional regulator n=1 Tax=Caulobacter sp. KR2-114 TaxID=3400912 RepID=UPI003BFE4E6C